MSCCDPCPWCGLEPDLEEVNLGNDYAFYHYCPNKEGCGWSDYMGRDITKEEWEEA